MNNKDDNSQASYMQLSMIRNVSQVEPLVNAADPMSWGEGGLTPQATAGK